MGIAHATDAPRPGVPGSPLPSLHACALSLGAGPVWTRLVLNLSVPPPQAHLQAESRPLCPSDSPGSLPWLLAHQGPSPSWPGALTPTSSAVPPRSRRKRVPGKQEAEAWRNGDRVGMVPPEPGLSLGPQSSPCSLGSAAKRTLNFNSKPSARPGAPAAMEPLGPALPGTARPGEAPPPAQAQLTLLRQRQGRA